jgi:hypothetical protein
MGVRFPQGGLGKDESGAFTKSSFDTRFLRTYY